MNAIWTVALSIFVAVHVGGDRLRWLDRASRIAWLSAAAGISFAYMFLHPLPQLAQGQREVKAATQGVLARLERHDLAAVAGLAVLYALERMYDRSRRWLLAAAGLVGLLLD